MNKNTQFINFLESMKSDENVTLINAIKKGFTIIESEDEDEGFVADDEDFDPESVIDEEEPTISDDDGDVEEELDAMLRRLNGEIADEDEFNGDSADRVRQSDVPSYDVGYPARNEFHRHSGYSGKNKLGN